MKWAARYYGSNGLPISVSTNNAVRLSDGSNNRKERYMFKERRRIVTFYHLGPEWQKKAIENLGEEAMQTSYIEPYPWTTPQEKVLMDLSQCIAVTPKDADGANAVISISNTCAMMLRIDDDLESAMVWFV